ncbi:MAG: tetratricopeptide repeat protein [Cyanothece sp. SIO2G6]|nr:tetratricopeptide repeat protein [Cyanothece sp. SIO2G6]
MRRYHIRLMVSMLVSLSAIAGAGESGRGMMPQSAVETMAQTDAEALLEEGDRLFQRGIQQAQISQFSIALQSWQQALELYRDPGVRSTFPQESRQREGKVLGNLGLVYRELSQYQQAIEILEQRLTIAREVRDRLGEGNALNILGGTYLNLGQYQQAINLFNQYLVIARELGNRGEEGNALGNLGLAYNHLGQYQQAIDLYTQSLVIVRELGERLQEGQALGNLGFIYLNLGQYQQALDFSQQYLDIAREMDNRASESVALHNLGAAHSGLSQYQQAIDFYEQSLAIAREIGNRAREGLLLGDLGDIYTVLGEYQQAIGFSEQSLMLAREIGNRAGEGDTLGRLGNTYLGLGQYHQAVDLFSHQLTITRDIGDRAGEGYALRNLGIAYLGLGQYYQAIDYFEQSLKNARDIGDRAGEGIALGELGIGHANLGQYQQAIDFFEQYLVITRDIGNRVGEGRVLGNLGNAHRILGQQHQAINYFEESLAIAREVNNPAGEGMSLNNLGLTLISTNQLDQAKTLFLQAIDIYESLRTDLSDIQLISLNNIQTAPYKSLTKALVLQENIGEALVFSERGRAQAFALQLFRRLRQTTDDPAPDNPASITLEQIQQIARATNTTLVEYAFVWGDLYIWVVQPSGEIEFRSVELNGEETGAMAQRHSDRSIALSTLDSPLYRGTPELSEVDTLVADSRSILAEPTDSTATPSGKLQELHQLLIDPIADLLPTDPNAPVAFIPQGSLFHVPFAALQDDNGTYLIEKHTILTAPSIQVLGLAHDTAQTRSGQSLTTNPVIVGNPTMPEVTVSTPEGFVTNRLTPLAGAETEALQIASVLNTTALTKDQATEATVKAQLPTASLIHLATHGLLDYGESPLDIPGAIALAPSPRRLALAPTATEDGLLTSGEILDMELQADLAILSACDTGLGDITGDGVVGLSRSLITAGVPSVMVSLWAVNDASTSRLMQRFYEFLATDEFTKAEALRQAQLSLLYGEDVETRLDAVRTGAAPHYREGFEPVGDRHPYHWAPFVLIGNGL